MKTKQLTLSALLAALTFVSSYFTFPIGPVPVTLQTFFVVLSGLVLLPKYAFLTQTISLLLLVIFKNALASPTFGFVIGFIVCASVIALITHRTNKLPIQVIAVIIGSLLIHVVGVLYFASVLSQKYTILSALAVTFTPFIIGDTLKAIAAIFISRRLQALKK